MNAGCIAATPLTRPDIPACLCVLSGRPGSHRPSTWWCQLFSFRNVALQWLCLINNWDSCPALKDKWWHGRTCPACLPSKYEPRTAGMTSPRKGNHEMVKEGTVAITLRCQSQSTTSWPTGSVVQHYIFARWPIRSSNQKSDWHCQEEDQKHNKSTIFRTVNCAPYAGLTHLAKDHIQRWHA